MVGLPQVAQDDHMRQAQIIRSESKPRQVSVVPENIPESIFGGAEKRCAEEFFWADSASLREGASIKSNEELVVTIG